MITKYKRECFFSFPFFICFFTLHITTNFSSSGLILWFGESSLHRNRDYLTIGLNDGLINVDIKLSVNKHGHNYYSKRFIANHTRIDDGQWHRLDFIRIGRQILIHIDDNITVRGLINGEHNQLNAQSALYLGMFIIEEFSIFSKESSLKN